MDLHWLVCLPCYGVQLAGQEHQVMPRFWFSGPRILAGLVRPGISFSGRELANAWGRKPPPAMSSALAVISRPGDGALVLCVPNHNGSAEDTPGHSYEGLFTMPTEDDALAVRRGAQQRLGVPVGDDTWICGKSAGQVLAACRNEARDLGLEPRFVRVKTGLESGKAERRWASAAWLLLALAVIWILVASGR
jgi:hypothetical protein